MNDDFGHPDPFSAAPLEDLADTVSAWPRGKERRRSDADEEVWSYPSDGAGSSTLRYRILGPVGIGGMGVVYRAVDTLLSRTVALKFLPPMLIPNSQAKERFLNEARAASALDHPNICTIYEVGETAEGQLFLAMACYDGETLQRKIERGPLEVAEAVHIALQVARGLAKAHRHRIVHRDIKPANLMITADGLVKILDFGIAKLPEQSLAGPLLGTPAYMSPEQARGEEVDARSDIWSLGAVLHEMLIGQPPGSREDTPDHGPTVSIQEVPPEINSLLSRMLAKDPGDRYPDAVTLLDDLSAWERAAADTGGTLVGERTRRRHVTRAAVLVVALASGFAYWLHRDTSRQSERGPAPIRAALTRLTDLPGREWFPSLSPDGNYFIYAKIIGEKSHLFLQRVGGGNPLDLTPDSGDDTQPAFSLDGQQIAFRSERDGGGIFVMGATGESVHRITNSGYNPVWSPDGREITFATEGIVNPRVRRDPTSSIFRVSLTTGKCRQVSPNDAVQPNWSPHGFRIAYWGISPSGQRLIWTVPAGGGRAIPVTNDSSVDWNPVWSPDGRYLYFASDRGERDAMNLWRVAIEERSGRVLGEPEPVTISSQSTILPSISKDGRRIAYASDDSTTILKRSTSTL